MSDLALEKRKHDPLPFEHPHYGRLPGTRGHFPRVALVMPVGRGSLTMTRAAVTTLYQTTAYPNWTLVTINDAAGDEMQAFLNSVPESIKLGTPVRRGFAENTNAGIRAVEADYYVLFSNDVLVYDPYWLHKMVALAESDPKIAVVGGGFNSCGSFWHLGANGTVQPFHYYQSKFFWGKPSECLVVSGFNMLVKGSVLKRIGLLDEGYYPAYGEEVDFCFRAVAHGYRVMDCLLSVYHVVRGGWRAKLGMNDVDRVRYSNTALDGAIRRLRLRWGPMLPRIPAATYRDAVNDLRRMAEEAPRLLPLQPELPPTCDLSGTVNPVFKTFPSDDIPSAIPFSFRRMWSNWLSQVGRVRKHAILLWRGRYDPREWEQPSAVKPASGVTKNP